MFGEGELELLGVAGDFSAARAVFMPFPHRRRGMDRGTVAVDETGLQGDLIQKKTYCMRAFLRRLDAEAEVYETICQRTAGG